jgi:hypothetical protein
LLAIDPGGAHIRLTDFNFFTSQEARDVVAEKGLILLDNRSLQDV